MKTLEAYWAALEEATSKLCELCVKDDDDQSGTNKMIPIDVIKVLLVELKNRQALRQQWDERRADKIYQKRITVEYRPVARPVFPSNDATLEDEKNGKQLPKDLSYAIQELSKTLQRRNNQERELHSSNSLNVIQKVDKPQQKSEPSDHGKPRKKQKKKKKVV